MSSGHLPASRVAIRQRPEGRVVRLAASRSVVRLGVVRDDVLHEQLDSVLTGAHAVAEQAEEVRAVVTLGGHVLGKTMCHFRWAPGLYQPALHGAADGWWC